MPQDAAHYRATSPEDVDRALAADILAMVDDMDEDELRAVLNANDPEKDELRTVREARGGDMEDELRAVLATQARRNPTTLESLQIYFDLSRKNASVLSAEFFSDILRQGDGIAVSHTGPIAMQKRYEHWMSVIQQLLRHANHRSLPETRLNAVSAIRRARSLYMEDTVRRGESLRALATVLRYMTPQERADLRNLYTLTTSKTRNSEPAIVPEEEIDSLIGLTGSSDSDQKELIFLIIGLENHLGPS